MPDYRAARRRPGDRVDQLRAIRLSFVLGAIKSTVGVAEEATVINVSALAVAP